MAKWLICIDGAGFSGFLPGVFGGALKTGVPKANILTVPYPNGYVDYGRGKLVGAPEAVAIGATKAFQMAEAIPDEDDVQWLAISMGTQVYAKMLDEHTLSHNPAKMSALLLGSPDHHTTGWSRIGARSILGAPPNVGVVGVPEDTDIETTYLTRQYDAVGDQPNLPNPNADAQENSRGGLFTHINYFELLLNDPKNKSYTPLVEGVPGNVTYTWSPTYPLPRISWLTWWKSAAALWDRQLRPKVELAYDRPVSMVESTPSIPPTAVSPKVRMGLRTPQGSPARREKPWWLR